MKPNKILDEFLLTFYLLQNAHLKKNRQLLSKLNQISFEEQQSEELDFSKSVTPIFLIFPFEELRHPNYSNKP